MNRTKVKIVGATGYTGGELIRFLLNHPYVDIVAVTASSVTEPQPVHTYWKPLRSQTDILVTKEDSKDACGADVVFLTTPHGVSMSLAQDYLDQDCIVIDLSADFRFRDPNKRTGWYPEPHPPASLCAQAVYAMPELFRQEIKDAQLIACPGCYATSVILSLYPGLSLGLFEPAGIHVSSASGVTGAGIKPKPHLHHPELDQNFYPYRIGKHQHMPEILDSLNRATGKQVSLTFIPHLLPLRRGIVTTSFVNNKKNITLQQVWDGYHDLYKDEPFVRVYDLGETPDLHGVLESNFFDISFHQDTLTGDIIIVAAEDNLGKGASGQAVQNFNIRMGYPEETALKHNPRQVAHSV